MSIHINSLILKNTISGKILFGHSILRYFNLSASIIIFYLIEI
jgi:hypothetical protein